MTVSMDLSDQYRRFFGQAEPALSDSEITELRDHYQFLLIKGFLGDLLPNRYDSYFADQMRWMNRNRFIYCRLNKDSGFGTQQLPETNCMPIIEAVKRLVRQHPGKSVVIISHSKGGIDTLAALLADRSLAGTEVAGWIALQAPFGGTPVADWATGNRWIGALVNGLLKKIFRGDQDVARSMGGCVREHYMSKNAEAIAELTQSMTVLSFSSYITASDRSLFTPLRYFIDRIARQPNDGLLPDRSEILEAGGKPCSPFVRIPHIDHIYPVIPLMPAAHSDSTVRVGNEREQIFMVLLKLWMDNRAAC